MGTDPVSNGMTLLPETLSAEVFQQGKLCIYLVMKQMQIG